jgi:F0F1-type ATP synthase beta subunit
MNIEIEKYMNMTADEFNDFVSTLHVKQIKQLYEFLRKQLIVSAYFTDSEGKDVADHIKKKALKSIVKRHYDAMGHVPNKKESKIIRQEKQDKKKTR